MADAARIGLLSPKPASSGANRHGTRPHGMPSFNQILHRTFQAQIAVEHGNSAIHRASFRTLFSSSTPLSAKPAPTTPSQADAALAQAMAVEKVPQSWHNSLHFIMSHESGGQVDARNPVHSARGLFQLTKANYHLNPRGAASFGNGVEEAQGGIRYIKERYGTADNAVAFWQRHHWY
jgi:hypothetical protein